MAFVEKTGKSVEEAVAEALKALNATADQVEIEVLEEGKKGFLGFFGSKDAKVRVTVKESAEVEAVEPSEAVEEKTVSQATSEAVKAVKEAATIAASAVVKKADELKEQASDAAEELSKKAAEAKEQAVDSAISTLEALKSEKAEKVEKAAREPRKYAVNDESVVAAKEFLQKVFKAMKINVAMEKFINKNDGSVTFKLHGDDMGILIGKHGQTLDSLQYLTNLVANKNSSERVRVIIDVEDYRDRRIETLTRLANRLADKVKRTGERVALEPMNPHERKIIHMALQGDRRVTTLSEGDDPYRHVVIELKK
ncbi:MAG: RNA-binding cell elongation regulator Jag/EloR [Phascolarctobacterium sp.]|nr:RNA-binding cell elongation regulator Jag/EloR [Phascolarctobacterium sp.]